MKTRIYATPAVKGLITYLVIQYFNKMIHNFVKSLKHNKSPGIDGLPGEFYKVFFPLVGKCLVDVYNESISKGELCESQKRSVLSLIFKKGDRCLLKNHRPISLSTTDYKILAHILASRIKPILPNIINGSQTGYVQGRFICQIFDWYKM